MRNCKCRENRVSKCEGFPLRGAEQFAFSLKLSTPLAWSQTLRLAKIPEARSFCCLEIGKVDIHNFISLDKKWKHHSRGVASERHYLLLYLPSSPLWVGAQGRPKNGIEVEKYQPQMELP